MGKLAEDLWTPLYVGERIATVRRRRDLTQLQLAAKIRGYGITVSDSMLPRYEKWGSGDRNARKPPFATLWVIAEILGVKVSDFGATEDEYPELALIRRGLATPSLLAGKANDGSVVRGFDLTYRRRHKPDSPAAQRTLQSSLIHGVPSHPLRETTTRRTRARPA